MRRHDTSLPVAVEPEQPAFGGPDGAVRGNATAGAVPYLLTVLGGRRIVSANTAREAAVAAPTRPPRGPPAAPPGGRPTSPLGVGA